MRHAEMTTRNPGRIRRSFPINTTNSQKLSENIANPQKLTGECYEFAVLPSNWLAGTAQSLSHANACQLPLHKGALEGVHPFSIVGGILRIAQGTDETAGKREASLAPFTGGSFWRGIQPFSIVGWICCFSWRILQFPADFHAAGLPGRNALLSDGKNRKRRRKSNGFRPCFVFAHKTCDESMTIL